MPDIPKIPGERSLRTREVVFNFMIEHLGCKPKEIVYGTGLTTTQVYVAYTSIRNEWSEKLYQAAKKGNAIDQDYRRPLQSF